MFLQKIKNIVGANLLIISLLLIFSGFLIMSINTTENNGGETFHQLTIAPILLFIGYSLVIFAIMKPKKSSNL
jgi:uncharacterized membrane protein